MKWTPVAAIPLTMLIAPAYASDYLTVEQAQAEMFPDATFQPVLLKLTKSVRDAMYDRSGVHEPFDEKGVWRTSTGGWFIVDHVTSKHGKIDYAVGLDSHGAVRAIEILSYQESYGREVGNADWRAQFVGKTSRDALQLGKDIRNISGATLSCRQVTQGVKRVLALYELVLVKG